MKKLPLLFCLVLLGFSFVANSQSILQQTADLASQERYAEAYALLENHHQTLSCQPCQPELAQLAYKAGNLKACIEHCTLALETDSTNKNCYLLLTHAYEKRGQIKEAYAMNEKLLLLDPTTASFHKTKAGLAIQLQEGSIAIKAYFLNPQDQETAYALSKLLSKLNLYKEAQHIALQYIALDDTHLGLIALMPKIYYQQKDYKNAKYWSRYLLSKQDTTVEAMKILAVSAVRTKAYDTAFACFTYLTKYDEMSEGLYFHKGLAFEQLEHIDSAQACYSKAIALAETENLGQYYYRLALSLNATENYREAIEHYKKAYSILKQRDILYHLARAYDNYYKDKKVAISYYQRYLQESDTLENEYTEYAGARITQIKEVMHLKLDSL